MRGEPIESVKVGIETMLGMLRRDPYALDTVSLSIITYDRNVKQILPLTPLDEVQMPVITTPESGPTHMGAALELLCQKVLAEVKRGDKQQKGDWMPILFIMTDGKPSDLQVFNHAVDNLKHMRFSNIVACAAGPKAKTEYLQQITGNVYRIDLLDGPTFMKFFTWLSDVIGEGGKSAGSAPEDIALPPPPSEINLVF